MAKEPSPRKDYYAEWYQRNKKKISETRKKAYHEDPKYREKVLARSAEHRESRRKEPRVKIARHMVPVKYTAGDGGEVILYSIGFFSIFIGRSIQSINEWEKPGKPGKKSPPRPPILPRTPYVGPQRKNGQGFRYYTKSMMIAVKNIIGNKRRLYPVNPEVYNQIEQAWAETGVPVGKSLSSLEAAIKATKTKGVVSLEPDEV